MSENEAVTVLIELLENTKSKQMPLRELIIRLQENQDININARTVIEYALDNWIVDKILDYDDNSEESIGKPVWFIRILDENEIEILRNLSKEAKCLLKILRKSDTDGVLGVASTSDLIKTLHERGHDLDLVPHIPGRVDDFFKTVEGELVQFHYLIPEDEKSEEYKAGLRELDEKTRRRLDRTER
ncbi:MAG: hypothetical protein ACFFDD_12700 [Promethearchaeota archaeon]